MNCTGCNKKITEEQAALIYCERCLRIKDTAVLHDKLKESWSNWSTMVSTIDASLAKNLNIAAAVRAFQNKPAKNVKEVIGRILGFY